MNFHALIFALPCFLAGAQVDGTVLPDSIAWAGASLPVIWEPSSVATEPKLFLEGVALPSATLRLFEAKLQHPGLGDALLFASCCGQATQVWLLEERGVWVVEPESGDGGAAGSAYPVDSRWFARWPQDAGDSALLPAAQCALPSIAAEPSWTYPMGRSCGLRPIALALETDPTFLARFADANQAGAFLGALVQVIGSVLGDPLQLAWQFPYLGLHSQDAGWWMADQGRPVAEYWAQFQTQWEWQTQVPHHLAHLISGAAPGGSLAEPHALTLGQHAAGMHGAMLQANGGISPDKLVRSLLHGLGHNLGARHTDEYCPPLDLCSPLNWAGPCQTMHECGQGTLMGFCHLCPSVFQPQPIAFHERNIDAMLAEAGSSLTPQETIAVAAAPVTAPAEPWVVELGLAMELTGLPQLRVFENGSWAGSLAMQKVSPCRYRAEWPGGECGASHTASIWIPSLACGGFSWPDAVLGQPISHRTQTAVLAWEDDGAQNQRWASLVGNAIAGYWVRGQPVADPQWPWAPIGDAGNDGWCFLTGNYFGNSDVDGGSVELVSPTLPIQVAPLHLEFDYALGLSNQNGNDRIELQVRSGGFEEPWILAWEAHLDSQGWVHTEVSWPGETNAAGPWQMRFLVTDAYPPSVVEAALDEFRVWVGGCP